VERPSYERVFFVSKDGLDTFNSLTWFLADALWMFELPHYAIPMIGLTLLSGLALLYIDKRLNVFFINLAIVSWICMNTLWIVSEFEAYSDLRWVAKLSFALGCLWIVMACMVSKKIRETFSHFRRFRTSTWIK
jgi:hypothetical protein